MGKGSLESYARHETSTMQWLAQARRGVCGVTTEGAEGFCKYGKSGSFVAAGTPLDAALRSRNWSQAAHFCLQRCAACARCRYVSLSLFFRDCSWYADCGLNALQKAPSFLSGLAPFAHKHSEQFWQPVWNESCGESHTHESVLSRWSGQCSEHYPAPGTHAVRLRRWVACTPPPYNISSAAERVRGGAGDSVPWYQGFTTQEIEANSPLDPSSLDGLHPSRQWGKAASCLSPHCIVAALSGRWVMLFGDSTQREIYSALVGVMASRYGATYRRLGPTIGGIATTASQHSHAQEDVDTIVTIPRYRKWRQTEPGAESHAVFVMSFRFLRGLDPHKLRLNVAKPQQLYFYPEWAHRSSNTPTHLVMSGDSPEQLPLPLSQARPDAIIFHSCAWDTPEINRSSYYYPHSACALKYANVRRVKVALSAAGDMRSNLTGDANVHGSACKERGEGLSDEQIFAGFEHDFNNTLRSLRRWLSRRTQLFVRSCHAGVQPPLQKPQSLRRMDTIIRRVAAAECVPLVDVWTLDREAGFYVADKADFHVPSVGSMQAAIAILFALTRQ